VGRLILDTSVIVSAERRVRSMADAIGDDDDVSIAAITVAELYVGVELAGPKKRLARAAFVDRVLEQVVVEPYTSQTARVHASLLAHTKRSGRSRGVHDLMIAATAIATERSLVTADARGFDRLPGLVLHLAE